MVLVKKWPVFPMYFFRQSRAGNVFHDILERKSVGLGYKNKKLKNLKIEIFSKGLTHGFGPKIVIFPNVLFFRKYRPGKCLLRYSRTKKHFSSL